MNPKLLEILKKAKQVDQRAKKLDSTNTTTLDSNIQSRQNSMPPSGGMVTEQPMNTPTMELPTSRPQPKVDVNSQSYKDDVRTTNANHGITN